jgi:hypothetical protein
VQRAGFCWAAHWLAQGGPLPLKAFWATDLLQSVTRECCSSPLVRWRRSPPLVGRAPFLAVCGANAVNRVNGVGVRYSPSQQSSKDGRKATFLLRSPDDSDKRLASRPIIGQLIWSKLARFAMSFAQCLAAALLGLSDVVAAAGGPPRDTCFSETRSRGFRSVPASR